MVFRRNFRSYRKNYRKRRAKTASRVISKFKPKKLSVNTVRRIAKKVVSREAENKSVQFFSTGSNIYPATSASMVPSIIPLSPYDGFLSINQGVDQGERIGNRIKIKNISIKGTIFPLPYDASTNPNPQPIQVIFWIFYSRQTPTLQPGGALTTWFQDGSTFRPLSGNLSDLVSKVNDDQYRLLGKRVFKIGYAAYEGSGIQPAFQAFHNNDFKLNASFRINVTKHVIRRPHFNDDSSNTPRDRGVFLLAQAINADGSTMANNIIPVRMTYSIDCTFEDI